MTDGCILDENIDGLIHTYRVTLDGARIASAVDIKLQDLGRKTQVPGFRPGRAPVSILRRHHGDRVRNAVVDRMAIEVARKLIAEKKFEPIRRPTIRIEEEGTSWIGPVEFSLILELAPQVELGPLEGFQLRRLRVPGGDPSHVGQSQILLRRQLFDILMERYDFSISQDMVEKEYDEIAVGYEAEVGETVGPEVECELRGIAARRVRLAILLAEIGHEHGIQVPRSEVAALVERQAELDPAHQAEIIDYYLDHPMALAELQSPLFEDRVVEFLLARSEIEEVEVGAEELRSALALT